MGKVDKGIQCERINMELITSVNYELHYAMTKKYTYL